MDEPRIIHLRLNYQEQCWTATMFDAEGHEHPETVALFGTATLPTPFTLKVGSSEVLKAIRERNPEADVILV